MRIKARITILILFTILTVSCKSTLPLPGSLKCEHAASPLGVDSPNPRLSWNIAGVNIRDDNYVYRISVASDSVALTRGITDMWDYRVLDPDKFLVRYGGTQLQPFTRYFWRVECISGKGRTTQSPVASFQTGMMTPSNWQGEWITDLQESGSRRSPLYRRNFTVDGDLHRATAYVAADSFYEFYVNGTPVTEYITDPVCLPEGGRIGYSTYDITSLVGEGENVAGLLLGLRTEGEAVIRPLLLTDIRLEYRNGKIETVSTDHYWKTSQGPYVFHREMNSEFYDASLSDDGWALPGYDDTRWDRALETKAPEGIVASQRFFPFRISGESSPDKVFRTGDTLYRFRFDDLMTGVVNLRIWGKSGNIATIRYSSDEDTYDSLAEGYSGDMPAWACDTVVLSGGEDRFRRQFAYRDFRFVEVATSVPLTLTVDNLTVSEIYRDIPSAGDISSSDLINSLHEQYRGKSRVRFTGNEFPEKNGTVEPDCHELLFPEAVLYNYDAVTLYENWMNRSAAALPEVISKPFTRYNFTDRASAAAGIINSCAAMELPWLLYLFYGDSYQMELNYRLLRDGLQRIEPAESDGLIRSRYAETFSGFPGIDAQYYASLHYYRLLTVMSKIASHLGESSDAVSYELAAARVRDAVNGKFFDLANGIYSGGTLAACAAALYYGIVPQEDVRRVTGQLYERLVSINFYTGDEVHALTMMLHALSDGGYGRAAYRLLEENFDRISGTNGMNIVSSRYGMSRIGIDNGETTTAELSRVEQWLYNTLGGIKPDERRPGFRNVLLQPTMAERVGSFYAEHTSPYGKIVSRWEYDGERVLYETRIPPGCTATLRLPPRLASHTGSIELKAGTHRMKFNLNK